MNALYFILIFVVITVIAVFFASRDKDELVDQDDKIPRGTAKKIDTEGQVIEIFSKKSSQNLKKMMGHKKLNKDGKKK